MSGETAAKEVGNVIKSMRLATVMGEGQEATQAALKLRDIAKQLTANVSEAQAENTNLLFELIREIVILMKNGLTDPTIDFQSPMQDLGRRIVRLASLIELDHTMGVLSSTSNTPGEALDAASAPGTPPTGRTSREAREAFTASQSRTYALLTAQIPSEASLDVPRPNPNPEPAPPAAAASAFAPGPGAPAASAFAPGPEPARPQLPASMPMTEEDELDLPPAESIGGQPMLDSLRRYAPPPITSDNIILTASASKLDLSYTKALPPVPATGTPALASVPLVAPPMTAAPTPTPAPAPAPVANEPVFDLAAAQEANAMLQSDLVGLRDSLTVCCDMVQTNNYPEAKEAIKGAHGYLASIVSQAVEHLELGADAAIMEGDFKDYVRSVAGALNDPALMPQFREQARALVTQATSIADRVERIRLKPPVVPIPMLAGAAEPDTKLYPHVSASPSGVWDLMPNTAAPYGVITPNVAMLRRLRGEHVNDEQVKHTPMLSHAWRDFESCLLANPVALRAVIYTAGTPALPNTCLDDYANSLVTLAASHESDIPLMCLVVSRESDVTEDPTTLFRGVSLAPKAATAFTRTWALPYLFYVADPTIEEVTHGAELEVDPTRATHPEEMPRNRQRFIAIASRCLQDIFDSAPLFPTPMRVFYAFVRHVLEKRSPKLVYRLLGGFYFLRFLCPVLSSPETLEFRAKVSNLSASAAGVNAPAVSRAETISPTARRSLLLLCKFLQQVSNETPFDGSTGGENEQLTFLNDLLIQSRPAMHKFFDEITDIRNCSTLPLSPFSQDTTLREDACRVLRHHLANAREYYRANAKPTELSLEELDRLLAVPCPTQTAAPTHLLVTNRMRELHMRFLQIGIEQMKNDVDKRRSERQALRAGSMITPAANRVTPGGPPIPVPAAGSTRRDSGASLSKDEKKRKEEEDKRRSLDDKKKEQIKKEDKKLQDELRKHEEEKKKEEDKRKEEERRRDAERKEKEAKAAALPATIAVKVQAKAMSYLTAIADAVRHCRMLYRLKGKKEWKGAYVVLLKTDQICFYDTTKDTAPLLVISIDRWTYCEQAQMDARNSFQIRQVKETWQFSIPEDGANAQKWMTILDGVCDKVRRAVAPSRFGEK